MVERVKGVTKVLDQVDIRILAALQEDARISNAELAEKIALSPSACHRRHELLEEAGYIDRYATILNQEKLGLKVNVFVSLELRAQDKDTLDQFEREIAKHPEVMECYLMTGDKDYLLRIVVTDLEDYERYLNQRLTKVKAVRDIRSSFALRRAAYRTALPTELLAKLTKV
jgi:Lrp/AsnC family transcriptional regulator, leucine-responsive regulatory protein